MHPTRITCVILPDLPVQVALRAEPTLADRPVVVVTGSASQRRTVAGASPAAQASGVRVGLPVQQALGCCPAAVVRSVTEAELTRAFAGVLAVLERCSPCIEPVLPDTAYLDMTGIDLQTLGEAGPAGEPAVLAAMRTAVLQATGMVVTVGAAHGTFPARVAAVTLAGPDGLACIPAGAERETLAPLPVTLLPCPPAVHQRLQRLGLTTLADVAALPFGPFQAQFGRAGAILWHLARGDDQRPLQAARQPARLVCERVFDDPIMAIETLLLLVTRELPALTAQLGERFASFRQITLAFRLTGPAGPWQHTWTLRQPAARVELALPAITATLRDLRLPGPVEALTLTVHDLCTDAGQQGRLDSIGVRRLPELTEAVHQVEARCGRNLLRRVVPLHPRSRIPERRYGLAIYDGLEVARGR